MPQTARDPASIVNDERPLADHVLRLLRDRLPSMRFGTISLTVHDGRLTQMDITERRRFGH